MQHIRLFAFPLLVSLLMTGCGTKGPSYVVEKKIKPAAGMFTIDGKPPGTAGEDGRTHLVIIKLYPKGRAPKPGEVVETRVGQDGKYSFSTYVEGDGAQAGDYIMCFESLNTIPFQGIIIGPDRFKNNFSNPVTQDPTKYSLTIPEQGKDAVAIPSIDIKMAELVDLEPNSFSTPLNADEAIRN